MLRRARTVQQTTLLFGATMRRCSRVSPPCRSSNHMQHQDSAHLDQPLRHCARRFVSFRHVYTLSCPLTNCAAPARVSAPVTSGKASQQLCPLAAKQTTIVPHAHAIRCAFTYTTLVKWSWPPRLPCARGAGGRAFCAFVEAHTGSSKPCIEETRKSSTFGLRNILRRRLRQVFGGWSHGEMRRRMGCQ